MDYRNPTIYEIEEWAYSSAGWPDVDWPLFLSWKEDVKTWLKLATDHKCPKNDFFRFMLYYQVGKAFQGGFGNDTAFIIRAMGRNGVGPSYNIVIISNNVANMPDIGPIMMFWVAK